MLDLHHSSIEMMGKGVGCKLDGGYNAEASLTAVAVLVREALAIGGGGWQCEGEKAEYGTLGTNPVVL